MCPGQRSGRGRRRRRIRRKRSKWWAFNCQYNLIAQRTKIFPTADADCLSSCLPVCCYGPQIVVQLEISMWREQWVREGDELEGVHVTLKIQPTNRIGIGGAKTSITWPFNGCYYLWVSRSLFKSKITVIIELHPNPSIPFHSWPS